MLIPGSFDTAGNAVVKIQITGDLGNKEYTAIIDTGFSGFVVIPLAEMIPLGLRTEGAASVMLGNGTIIDNLVARGSVTLGSQTQSGTVLLDETSNDILIGMSFLRTFNLALIVTATVVVLYGDQETLDAVAEFMAAAPTGSPTAEPDPASGSGQ